MEDQKNISITKVALTHGMFLKVSYKEHLPNNDERLHSNVSCSAPVHEDLANAFKQFTPHLALICEEITNEEFIEAIPEEYDATQPSIVEMGELVPAIKATRSKKKGKSNESFTSVSMVHDGKETDISNLFGGDHDIALVKAADAFETGEVEFKFAHGFESISISGSKQLSTLALMSIKSPSVKLDDDKYKYASDLAQLGELLKYEVSEYILNHKYAPAKDPELPFGDGSVLEEEQY